VFCVGSGQLLGSIVSKYGIQLNPCKVQAIIDMPPPSNLLQIQKLQGKANILRSFIPNYAKLSKEYMIFFNMIHVLFLSLCDLTMGIVSLNGFYRIR